MIRVGRNDWVRCGETGQRVQVGGGGRGTGLESEALPSIAQLGPLP
jgi:hypothetical protein